MESLISYGSDDDYDEPADTKKQGWEGGGDREPHSPPQRSSSARVQDVNYEEVQMDMSEDSNDSKRAKSSDQERDSSSRRSSTDSRPSPHRNRGRRDDGRHRDKDRGRRDRDRDRDYDRRRVDRKRSDRRTSRDDERRRSRRCRKRRYRDRSRDRKHRRSRSRSRSTKRDHKSRRSSSTDRSTGRSGYSGKRYDKAGYKKERLEKLGISIKGGGNQGASSDASNDLNQENNRFFMPGITGRFTEQIQKRKLLWQKKEAGEEKPIVEVPQTSQPVATGCKQWQNTTFAQDSDGKVANKFKRLMGIRKPEDGTVARPASDIMKKQEEMFSSMEAQYEVARTATHTMRGVGLGFGSFQR